MSSKKKPISKLLKIIHQYLFAQRGSQEVTLAEFSKDHRKFNRLLVSSIFEEPAWLAIVLSVTAGTLFTLWNLSITLLKYVDLEQYPTLLIFLDNIDETTSWIALFSFVFVIVVYTAINSWGVSKFRARKYPDADNCDQNNGKCSIKDRKSPLVCVLIVISFNSALIPVFMNDVNILSSISGIILSSIALLINFYHFWTLRRPKFYQHKHALARWLHNNSFSVVIPLSFTLLAICAAQFFLFHFRHHEWINSIAYVLFVGIVLYSYLWLCFIGIGCINESTSRSVFKSKKSTDPTIEKRSRSSWIFRNLRIWMIMGIVIIPLLIITFSLWIITTANILSGFSSLLESFLG